MVEGYQMERVVELSIQQLDPDFREILVLRDIEELSYDELSEITGLPDGTVKSRLHRARAMLKAAIERKMGDRDRMTHPGDEERPSSAPELEASGESSMRDLLRGLGERHSVPDLTQGVQQKIRQRSGGKFYADGWSTSRHPPLNTYLISSLLMLFVLGVVYALLAPLSGAPERAKPPAAVQVVPGP
ncbi:MAG: sigma factor-like helix-turn-helix DNA-binding protein [Polyangiaceae bacterium]